MNSDKNDAQETAAAALLEIHQRLLEDGVAWRDDLLLGATRSTQAPAEQTTPHGPLNERTEHVAVMTQPPNTPRRDVSWGRRLVASAAIVVVVGLLAALFATFAHNRNDTHLTSARLQFLADGCDACQHTWPRSEIYRHGGDCARGR